ncbi:hypothetical protein [Oceanicella actignis]|uniref:baeRF10 domain-containing protein n=1 Tax=Oceanicella actignis TaxID=1189325 RepID=UPI0011E7CFB9|nr:hypothetical protein [Oceanicella actignis]TYO90153.1 eRF1-like protein [Oceanicella actignis]
MLHKDDVARIFAQLEEVEAPALTVYADIDPSNPDNRGGAWRARVKNALKDIEPIHKRPEHGRSLADDVIEALSAERPEARSLAVFARQNHLGKTSVLRIDLNVALPVVDLREGRVEARWGEPWIAPLAFALDEHERTAALHVGGGRWRLFEIFLGEAAERGDLLAHVAGEDWAKLREASEAIRSGAVRASATPDLSGSNKDHATVKLERKKRELYARFGRVLEKALAEMGAGRLVLIGDEVETAVVLAAAPRGVRARVAAVLPNPAEDAEPDAALILRHVAPALEKAERAAENALLDAIAEQPGVWGLDPTLDALQLGRVEVLVLPWECEAEVWRCENGMLFGAEEPARKICEAPRKVRLADHVLDLAAEHGARVEFVRGDAAERLAREFKGAAARLRW